MTDKRPWEDQSDPEETHQRIPLKPFLKQFPPEMIKPMDFETEVPMLRIGDRENITLVSHEPDGIIPWNVFDNEPVLSPEEAQKARQNLRDKGII